MEITANALTQMVLLTVIVPRISLEEDVNMRTDVLQIVHVLDQVRKHSCSYLERCTNILSITL